MSERDATPAVNFVIKQGCTFRKTLTYETGDTPVPVDLTGCSAQMQIRESIDTSAALLNLTSGNGGLVLGDEYGTIEIYISDTDTGNLTVVDAVYDLIITFPNSDVKRLVQGQILVEKAVTR